MRLESSCGTKAFGSLPSDTKYTAVRDEVDLNGCNPFQSIYDESFIDETDDGTQTVKCAFKRDAIASKSQLKVTQNGVLHFYAGFNVWADYLVVDQRVTGGVSQKIEIQKIVEESNAISNSIGMLALASTLITSFIF